MKAKQYQYRGRDLDYSGSQENWEFISDSLDKHREQAVQELELAKAEYAEAVKREELVIASLRDAERDEHLFYKLHLMTNKDWDEEAASKKATIVCFQRHPPKTFHGMYHRSLKIGDQTLSTKKASFLFEQVDDETLNYADHIWVTIYYLQGYTFFMLQYRYNVLEKRMAKNQPRVEIKVIETEKMMQGIKTRRLLKRFMKEHPAVYAAYLMDK